MYVYGCICVYIYIMFGEATAYIKFTEKTTHMLGRGMEA